MAFLSLFGARIFMDGDLEGCKAHLEDVKIMASQLKQQAGFQNVPVYRLEQNFADGTNIKGLIVNGQQQIAVTKPIIVPTKIPIPERQYQHFLNIVFYAKAYRDPYFSGYLWVYESGKWRDEDGVLVVPTDGNNSEQGNRMGCNSEGLIAIAEMTAEPEDQYISVFVSTDWGKTFKKVTEYVTLGWCMFDIDVDEKGNIWFLRADWWEGSKLFKSSDSGKTFELAYSDGAVENDDMYYMDELQLGITVDDGRYFAFGAEGETKPWFRSNAGLFATIGDSYPGNPYSTGQFSRNPQYSDTYGYYPCCAVANETVCVMMDNWRIEILYGNPFKDEYGEKQVYCPFDGAKWRWIYGGVWSQEGGTSCSHIQGWSQWQYPDPVEFKKHSTGTVIFRNSSKVWDSRNSVPPLPWSLPNDPDYSVSRNYFDDQFCVRGDPKTKRWVATAANLAEPGVLSDHGVTMGILYSEDDGMSWQHLAVDGAVVADGSAWWFTNCDIFGDKIAFALSSEILANGYYSTGQVLIAEGTIKSSGIEWKKLLDKAVLTQGLCASVRVRYGQKEI